MKLDGTIYMYDETRNLISYSNGINSEYNVVLIGGLMFNMLNLPYVDHLNVFCRSKRFGFYIPLFRSHPNYGIYKIEDDLEDLEKLLDSIKGKIILIGNSTGCQVIMKYIKNKSNVILCILQGAVSDVEYERSINPDLDKNLELAESFVGVLPFQHDCNYITAERYTSLLKPFGNEDLFSSYLEDAFYKKLNPLKVKLIFLVSENDEFAIENITKKLSCIENSTVYEINGDHFLSKESDIKQFLEILNKETSSY
ncbi:UPF0613 protein PB24D3.06c [Nosema granulosis]|uniref:UPF0613 protein PB24D3.06c n=1 Tax=Nosema granulosis TaxID=83296 RepID=A0A9P6H075_9MICR|nr:UPF0613 protein PB24D3.06c [Nosema granulosis]